MMRNSESPQNPHPYAQLRSRITLQNDHAKSSQQLRDSRPQQGRLTELKSDFRTKQVTQSTLMGPQEKNSSTTRLSNLKNPQMSASYMPDRKDQLLVTLKLSQGVRSVQYPFGPQTTINELTSHLRGISSLQNVIFRSSDLMLDHLLTLEHQKVGLLRDAQPISLRPQPIHLDSTPDNSLKRFTILKCIGSGGFSKVYLAQVYGVFLALKVIDKRSLLAQDKALIIQNERKVLLAMDHPFIAHMHYALETEKYVVLGLEYCCGGELFYHLKRRRRLREAEAKFYFLELLAALKALHDKGIVYRDMKPQNVILDSDGHIRLADFGLSKFISEDELTHSFCGSAQYMAPQMLSKTGHNFAIDFYCLGALLYELVTGLPPYYSSNQDILYQSILNSPVEFPQDITLSPQVKSLLSSLLVKDPDRRLGTIGGAAEIIAHPWFNGVSIIDVVAKKLTPPLRPNLLGCNFDDSEYKAEEFQNLELLKKEKEEGDLRVPQLGAFFYQSEAMKRKREFLQQSATATGSMKKKTNHIETELGLKSKIKGTTSTQEFRDLPRKTESNTSKMRNNRYYLQPYNKYGSSSPANDPTGKSQSLKYKLPASTKALLHKTDKRVTPENRRQYSQQISPTPYRTYSKDHIFEGSYDVEKTKYRSDKYEKYGAALNVHNGSSASKILERKHYEYGHKREESPAAGLLKIKSTQTTASSIMGSTTSRIQQPELRKGYLNKDKIRNYLTGVYKN